MRFESAMDERNQKEMENLRKRIEQLEEENRQLKLNEQMNLRLNNSDEQLDQQNTREKLV